MRILRLVLCAGLGWSLLGCQPEPPAPSSAANTEAPAKPAKPMPKPERAGNAPALTAPASADPLPDFAAITDTKAKKAAFFAFLRPMVLAENQRIMELRDYLKRLQARQKQQLPLHPDDLAWLAKLSARHRVDAEEIGEQLQLLLRKLHKLPVSLVLAQAANESAWGTSRFAKEGNNLFGQWCFKPGCGITPKARPEGETYEVAAFPTVAASVHAYFNNLNGNRSFASLRKIRRCLLNNKVPLSGRALAAGLGGYSARGNHYVKELRSMIRYNQLEPWAEDWWGNGDTHPCSTMVQVEITKADPLLAQTEATMDGAAQQATDAPPQADAETKAPAITGDDEKQPSSTSASAVQAIEENDASEPAEQPAQG